MARFSAVAVAAMLCLVALRAAPSAAVQDSQSFGPDTNTARARREAINGTTQFGAPTTLPAGNDTATTAGPSVNSTAAAGTTMPATTGDGGLVTTAPGNGAGVAGVAGVSAFVVVFASTALAV